MATDDALESDTMTPMLWGLLLVIVLLSNLLLRFLLPVQGWQANGALVAYTAACLVFGYVTAYLWDNIR